MQWKIQYQKFAQFDNQVESFFRGQSSVTQKSQHQPRAPQQEDEETDSQRGREIKEEKQRQGDREREGAI